MFQENWEFDLFQEKVKIADEKINQNKRYEIIYLLFCIFKREISRDKHISNRQMQVVISRWLHPLLESRNRRAIKFIIPLNHLNSRKGKKLPYLINWYQLSIFMCIIITTRDLKLYLNSGVSDFLYTICGPVPWFNHICQSFKLLWFPKDPVSKRALIKKKMENKWSCSTEK